MKEIVICANSYLQYKNALYIATQNYHKRLITILVVGSHDLFKFFSAINERLFNNDIKLIFSDLFRPNPRRAKARGLKKVFYILPDIIRERRHQKKILNKNLAGIEGSDVYFFDRGFNNFPLVKRLRKSNKLIYMPAHHAAVTPKEHRPADMTDWARLLIYKLTYGWGIALGELPYEKGFPLMSDKFLEQEVDTVIGAEEQDKMMKDFEMSQFKIFDTSRYRAIYFFDDLGPYASDEKTYRRELVKIFDILSKRFPANEIARKYHAGYLREETGITTGDVLPDFIPAELLYDDNVKIYLSGYSTALSNVEKGLAVSIIDLVSFGDERIRETLKEIVIRMGRSKILFPQSLHEFEEILISLCSNKKNSSVE